ncbi:formylglycine-generating enzyme family protein [Algiphilus sp.]|uniref:formylglycine-generating enzyme family protein n=1 Tax=Algiphilus sp. TaxID=1872431 RepID=UPI003B5192A9
MKMLLLVCAAGMAVASFPGLAAEDGQGAHTGADSNGAAAAFSGFRDCPQCPEMVLIPSGEARLGSPESEAGRDPDEGPRQSVSIAQPLAFGRHEVTVGQFAAFVDATGYETDAERNLGGAEGCLSARAVGARGQRITWEYEAGVNWRNPGFEQSAQHPVVCVSWFDAIEYLEWLSDKTDANYRLPTEAEWEYAARAGSEGAFYFGDELEGICAHANHADDAYARSWDWPKATRGANCDDGAARTAPIGSYRPNAFGLHEMLGNVWEYTGDCYIDTLAGMPADGSVRITEPCPRRVARGGAWRNLVDHIRAANRYRVSPVTRSDFVGFRAVRALNGARPPSE